MYRIGVDLGGTKIEGIVLDDDGRERFRKRVSTEQEHGYDHIIENIAKLYQELTDSISGADHTFGIGTPGAISKKKGMLCLSNTVCLNGKPLKKDIENRIEHNIELQNDANCFAMAEAIMGAGKGHETVFGVIMGSGCGGGIIHKGHVISGLNLRGGEWGHMSIDPNGPLCFCGRRGCVELFISGGGSAMRYKEEFGENRSLKDIEDDYYRGEQRAVQFMDVFFKHFGRAIANVITVLDPDIIVLGGGVSKFKDLYTRGAEEVANCVLGKELKTPIVQHELGDSAGVIGAAIVGV
ncbi:MAG: ROK family protein [Kiritimatiellae bacterium]|nr:ROK family protein [Kiritimatiellia bacterium]